MWTKHTLKSSFYENNKQLHKNNFNFLVWAARKNITQNSLVKFTEIFHDLNREANVSHIYNHINK